MNSQLSGWPKTGEAGKPVLPRQRQSQPPMPRISAPAGPCGHPDGPDVSRPGFGHRRTMPIEPSSKRQDPAVSTSAPAAGIDTDRQGHLCYNRKITEKRDRRAAGRSRGSGSGETHESARTALSLGSAPVLLPPFEDVSALNEDKTVLFGVPLRILL
jgi:hypothetical protein